jgi:hypothetical protein
MSSWRRRAATPRATLASYPLDTAASLGVPPVPHDVDTGIGQAGVEADE